MKRTFTKLMAALALLLFIAPLGMMGQTRTEGDTHEFAQSLSQLLNSNASIPSINIVAQSYPVKKVTISYRYNKTIENAVTMAVSVNGVSWGTAYSTETGSNYTTVDFQGTSVTGSVAISFTNNTGNGTGHGTFYVDKVILTEGPSGGTPTTYTVTFDAGDGTFVGSDDFPNASNTVVAGTYTLPSATPAAGYTFDGWAIGEDTYQGGDSYTVSGNADFTASYTQNGGSSTETATLTVSSFPNLTSSYTSGTVTVDEIEYSYANFIKNSSSIQVKASSGLLMNNTAYPGDITSVVITHSGTANPTTIYGSADGTNWTQVATGSGSINANFSNYHFKYFKITRGTGAAYWTKVEITYSSIATYSVTYDANGATSGTVPTDATVYDDENNTVTVLGNTGNLTKTGCTWAGWNTQADGNGTNYTTGNTFTISANTTLYAKWNTKTITNLSYTGTPATTTYYAGQSFDPTGLTVTATFNDNSSENVTSSVVWTPNPLTQGTTSVTGTYMGQTITVNGLTVTATPGTENNPYTVAQAIAATPSSGSTDNVYIHGIVCAFYGNYDDILDENAHRYYISDDGNTTTKLLVYKGKGLNNVAFSNVNDLLIGDEITVLGQLKMYSNAPEVDENNYIVSLVRPGDYTLTNAMTNVAEYSVFVGDDEIEFDNNQAQVRAGATVYVSLTMEDCYALTSLTVNGSTTGVTEIEPGIYYSFVMPEGDATIGVLATQATQYTLTVVGGENVSFDLLVGSSSTPAQLIDGTVSICEQLHVTIDDLTVPSGFVLEPITLTYGNITEEVNATVGFTMPSSNATLTFTTHEVATFTYTKVTSVTPGKHYIIVTSSTDSNGKYHAMGGKNSGGSYMDPIVVSVDNNTVTVAENEGVAEILIGGTIDNYTLHTSEGYLVGGNKLMNTNGSEESTWTISFNENNQAIITWTINTTGYSIQYNSANPRFACYSSAQAKVCLYEKNEYDLSINGYTDVTEGTNNRGYYLIASPVNVNPATVAGMTDGDFDLYRFNQAAALEWENWKNEESDNFHFNLVPGTGYLYAKKATTENQTYSFTLTGIPYAGNGTIDLDYDANAEFPGFNLIGNPFGSAATLDMPFYRMAEGGAGFTAKIEDLTNTIAAMEGVFVEASTIGEKATFTPARNSEPQGIAYLSINVNKNRGEFVDNAIVRFDGGQQLGKFSFRQGSTKVYMTENSKDYAVVRSAAEAEMPVSFRASENGTYTLAVEAENVEMSYLHLIDNLTGNDVDLLATPSYTFEANTTDYASRFRLVFSANSISEDADGNNAFAYYNGSSWTVSNVGEATLQVVDMMGRVLSSETLNGNANVTLNQAAGIYMLRLVNGENVKVQKVVVR